jgi:hypothetical protein
MFLRGFSYGHCDNYPLRDPRPGLDTFSMFLRSFGCGQCNYYLLAALPLRDLRDAPASVPSQSREGSGCEIKHPLSATTSRVLHQI